MQCPNCGSDNRPGVQFCEECGQPITVQVEAASTPRWLVWAVILTVGLVVLMGVGLGIVVFKNPGPLQNSFAPPSAAKKAISLADEFVIQQYPEYASGERVLRPISEHGQRVFLIQYSRMAGSDSSDSLLVVVNPTTKQVRVLESNNRSTP